MRLQGISLHGYERQFANLPDHLQLIKLCSNAGIAKTVAKGHYLTTLDDAELDKLERLMSRVHITSRRHFIQAERMDPWEHEDRSSIGGGSQSSRPWRHRDHSTSCTPSCTLSSTTRSSWCYSAAEKSEGTLNASHSFTGYEPNVLTFGELNDSSGSLLLHDPVIGPGHG